MKEFNKVQIIKQWKNKLIEIIYKIEQILKWNSGNIYKVIEIE
jgi:hypothetical protein